MINGKLNEKYNVGKPNNNYKVDIKTYLHDLLLEHENVTIPGFGTFSSRYKPAEITSEKILPPGKVVTFDPEIRNNDGVLVGFVAEREGISHFDALKKIEEERDAIAEDIRSGKKIVFENTGILKQDESGRIVFESFKVNNLSLDSYGLDEIPVKEFIRPTEKQEKPAEPVAVPVAETEKPEKTSDKRPPDPEPVPSYAEIKDEYPGRKKKKGWLWLLLILIPILAVGAFIGYRNFMHQDLDSTPVEKGVEITEIPVAEIDSAGNDTIKVEDKDTLNGTDQMAEEEIQLSVADTVVKPEVPLWYLIGGSFKEKENADKYYDQMVSEGYEPFHLGKRGNFHIVGIGKFETGKEVVQAKREFLENNPESGVWILKE